MSFLNDLEKVDRPKKKEKTPRQLWESCFKYFKHFVSIVQKNNDEFETEFSLAFLNQNKLSSKVVGPFEISRFQIPGETSLEVKFVTQLDKTIKVQRKDFRSAELLTKKLRKEGVISTIKKTDDVAHNVEIKDEIKSSFKIILKKELDFYIQYTNISSSNTRLIKLPLTNINQDYMDELAKYIVGKNPDMYKEKISNREISKIRNKIVQDKIKKKVIDKKIQDDTEKEKKIEQIKKDNTISEKAKKIVSEKSQSFKDRILNKFIKSK